MTCVRSKNISLKYQRFTTLDSKDIGIRKSEFVAKSQFLYDIWKQFEEFMILETVRRLKDIWKQFVEFIIFGNSLGNKQYFLKKFREFILFGNGLENL